MIQGALAIIKSPNLNQLSTLDLELNEIGREPLTKFPDGTAISSLSRLNLRRNQIEDSTISDWLQTGAFVPVKHLNLGWNKIKNAGAAALAKSPMLSGLEQLMP